MYLLQNSTYVTCSEHIAAVICVACSTNNSLIISGGDDSSIIVSALQTGKLVSTAFKINKYFYQLKLPPPLLQSVWWMNIFPLLLFHITNIYRSWKSIIIVDRLHQCKFARPVMSLLRPVMMPPYVCGHWMISLYSIQFKWTALYWAYEFQVIRLDTALNHT